MSASAYRKRLIKVALPLPEINDAWTYDKVLEIGARLQDICHWRAWLELAAAKAVLIVSVGDDPSEHPDGFPTTKAAARALP